MDMHYLLIVKRKIEIARKLSKGEIKGTAYEAMLIITSILSATASIFWPGESIDRKRFVELLIQFNNTEDDFSKICIPFLNGSRFLSKEQENKILRGYNTRSHSQLLTGNDIDISEHIITSLFPTIELRKLREYSYANIFYKFIRSVLVHEYSASEYASFFPMTQSDVFVSYNNNIIHPFRRICFHINHLIEITEGIALETAHIIENAPLPIPAKWWLEGAILER